MKRKIALVMAVVLAATLAVQPYDGHAASELDKINQQIKALEREMNRQAQQKKDAEKNTQNLLNQKEATVAEINALAQQIDQAGKQLADTEKQVHETEQKLQQAGRELDEALAREQSISDQLDVRVRLMYTNGTVSYLDVLFSSTSFSDFIDRFDTLQSITTSTKTLLEEQKAVRSLKEQKQAEVQQQLQEVEALYKQRAEQLADLQAKESAKEALVAKLDQEIEHLEEISEEAEKELAEMADKMAKLENEKSRIETYYKGGKLGMPLKAKYRLSSGFGYRQHPITGKNRLHSGMDMAVAQGTPIYAAESGRVILSQWWSGYGYCIIIDHGGGLRTLYGHIKSGGLLVEKGDNVKRGQKIALVGSTGQSTGPHLHFEVRKDNTPVDPAPYLK